MKKLNHLFQPIRVGNLKLKNRLVLLSMTLGYAANGKPLKRLINFLEERAKGGAGIICTTFNICPSSEGHVGSMSSDASEDAFVPALKELTGIVHSYGVPIVGQLATTHLWRKDKNSQFELVGPSSIAVRPKAPMPRAMTIDEIHAFIFQHGEAARRIREAGFDAVEVMGGVGGTISRFMSPCANKRTDEFGGNFENRMRLPLEIIDDIKKKAGKDFTILWRYSGHEFLEGGYDLEGAKEIGKVFEKAGISWLSIQAGWHDSPMPLITKEVPEGHFSYLAEEIKKAVNIPVVTSYRITDPFIAERILAEKKADLIGMARALIADPDFANKAREGRFDEIRSCICCCRCIDQCVAAEQPLDICSVNPRMGVDLDNNIEKAIKPKRIFVIGGGPGGMETATIAADRGHKVSLYERGPRLGGAMVFGALFNTQLTKLINNFKCRIQKLPIELKLGKEADIDIISNASPDVVVVASGGNPISIETPGIDGANVMGLRDAMGLLTGRLTKRKGLWQNFLWRAGLLAFKYFYSLPLLRWALGSNFLFGKSIAIIGGGFAACELAEFMIDHGKQVTIITESKRVGEDIGPSTRWVLMMKLRKAQIKILNEAKVVEITKKGVKVNRNGAVELVQADTIVPALGMKETTELAKLLAGKAPAVYSVGDCVEPRKIAEAVKAGYRLGREL